MNKIAVVYWSGTGNTKAMAEAIAEGASTKNKEVFLLEAGVFDAEKVEEFDRIAFGCPSMGAEVLEEETFEPMFADCLPLLANKEVALFGSYGWGDGEWMRDWEVRFKYEGIVLLREVVIFNEAPDDAAVEQCRSLGKLLSAD
ncbi:MAG: flavodoxin [Anaerovoracaceae bacterium]